VGNFWQCGANNPGKWSISKLIFHIPSSFDFSPFTHSLDAFINNNAFTSLTSALPSRESQTWVS
jgi:hypothetical protein